MLRTVDYSREKDRPQIAIIVRKDLVPAAVEPATSPVTDYA